MLSRKTITIISLLILALLTSWSVWQHNLNKAKANQQKNPDSFATNVTFVKMDADGVPEQQLTAPLITHYPNDITDLTTPHFTLYMKNSSPWHLSANYGQLQDKGDTLVLKDNVKLEQPAGKDNLPLTMTTTELTIYPKTKYAHTQQPVTIVQPGRIVHAIGLNADANTKVIDLLSQVRAEIQPAQK